MDLNMTKFCGDVSAEIGVTYVLRSQDLMYEEAFSDRGLLPAVAQRANMLAKAMYGSDIGVEFLEDAGGTLGKKVVFSQVDNVFLRLMCVIDVLSELAQSADAKGKVSLDELLYD